MRPLAGIRGKHLTNPVTRLVFAVAAHLHMTAGDVRTRMDSHELFCWGHILFPPEESNVRELTVEDEIAEWR